MSRRRWAGVGLLGLLGSGGAGILGLGLLGAASLAWPASLEVGALGWEDSGPVLRGLTWTGPEGTGLKADRLRLGGEGLVLESLQVDLLLASDGRVEPLAELPLAAWGQLPWQGLPGGWSLPFHAPDAVLSARWPGGEGTLPFSARGRIGGGGALTVDLDLEGTLPAVGRLEAQAQVALRRGVLELASAQLAGAVQGQASGRWSDWPTGPLQLEASGRTALGPLGQAWGLPLQGEGDAELRLERASEVVQATFTARAPATRVEGRGQLQPRADWSWSGEGQLAVEDLQGVWSALRDPVQLGGSWRVNGVGFGPEAKSELAFDGSALLAGIPLSAVSAAAVQEGAALRVTELALGGPSVDLRGEGRLTTEELALNLSGPLSLGALAPLGLPPEVEGQAQVQASLNASPGGGIQVLGELRVEDGVGWRGVTARGLNLSWGVTAEGGALDLRGDLQAERLEALGVEVGRLSLPGWTGRREPGGAVALAGPVGVERVQALDWASVPRLGGRSLVALAPGEPPKVQATLSAPSVLLGGLELAQGGLALNLDGGAVRFGLDLDRARLQGSADLDARVLRWEEATLTPLPGLVLPALGPGRLQLGPAGLSGLSGSWQVGAGGALRVSGGVGEVWALDLEGEGLKPELLLPLLGGLPAIEGELKVSGKVRGPRAAPEVELTWEGADLAWPGHTRPMRLDGRLRLADAQGQAELHLSGPAGELARAEAQLPLTLQAGRVDLPFDQPFTASLELREGRAAAWLERVEGLPPTVARLLEEAAVEGSLRLSGTLAEPQLSGRGAGAVPLAGWVGPARLELAVDGPASAAAVSAALFEGEARRLAGGGVIQGRLGSVLAELRAGDLPDRPADPLTWLDGGELSFTLDHLRPPELLGELGLPVEARGALVGQVGLGWAGLALRPAVDLRWIDPGLGPLAASEARIQLGPVLPEATEAWPLRADLTFLPALDAEGQPLAAVMTVQGDLPAVDLAGGGLAAPLDLQVAGQVPLALLALARPRELEGPRGALEVTGAVGGTPNDPRPALAVLGEGLALTYLPFGVRAEGVALAARADRFGVTLDQISGRTTAAHAAAGRGFPPPLGPAFQASGAVVLEDLWPADSRLQVTLDQALVSGRPERALQVSGAIGVAGRFPHLDLQGDLAFDRCRVHLDPSLSLPDLDLNTPPVELDPVVRLFRKGPSEPTPPPAPPLWAPFSATLRLDLGSACEGTASMAYVDDKGGIGAAVSTLTAHARLEGGLTLSLKDEVPALFGTLEVPEGTVRLLGSRLAIERGEVVFSGPELLNPGFEVFATLPVTDARVDLVVTGSLNDPHVLLLSDDFEHHDQLLTAVLLGENPERLDSSQRAAAMGGALVGSLVNAGLQSTDAIEIELVDATLYGRLAAGRRSMAVVGLAPLYQPWQDRLLAGLELHPWPTVRAGFFVGDFRRSAELVWRRDY